MAFQRGALDLLNIYGNDSSDEEVPGSKVSTKRMHKDSEDEIYTTNKRKMRLPVPDIMKVQKPKVNDDPNLHDGKIRSFPHERGNWATYVYIPYQCSEGIGTLVSRITSYIPNLNLKTVDHFHISLTRVVILRHHWIESFVQSIREIIRHIKCFMIMLDCLEVYCNEERTRTFIGLRIRTGYDTLTKIVSNLDKCLREFNLPEFYKDPSFHMSIVWCVGDHEEMIRGLLPELNKETKEIINETSQDNWYIYVNHLECKTGNKFFCFNML